MKNEPMLNTTRKLQASYTHEGWKDWWYFHYSFLSPTEMGNFAILDAFTTCE